MAREFSRRFYKTPGWKKTREYIFKKQGGVCQDCLRNGELTPGQEVHHIEFLTPYNMNDNDVTLGENNLVLLCKECHHKRHSYKRNKSTDENMIFDDDGELIYSPPLK